MNVKINDKQANRTTKDKTSDQTLDENKFLSNCLTVAFDEIFRWRKFFAVQYTVHVLQTFLDCTLFYDCFSFVEFSSMSSVVIIHVRLACSFELLTTSASFLPVSCVSLISTHHLLVFCIHLKFNYNWYSAEHENHCYAIPSSAGWVCDQVSSMLGSRRQLLERHRAHTIRMYRKRHKLKLSIRQPTAETFKSHSY